MRVQIDSIGARLWVCANDLSRPPFHESSLVCDCLVAAASGEPKTVSPTGCNSRVDKRRPTTILSRKLSEEGITDERCLVKRDQVGVRSVEELFQRHSSRVGWLRSGPQCRQIEVRTTGIEEPFQLSNEAVENSICSAILGRGCGEIRSELIDRNENLLRELAKLFEYKVN